MHQNWQEWQVCAARRCTVQVHVGKGWRGPAFCSDQCKALYHRDNPRWVPMVDGPQITDELAEFNTAEYR